MNDSLAVVAFSSVDARLLCCAVLISALGAVVQYSTSIRTLQRKMDTYS